MGTLTVRLDAKLEKELAAVAEASGRQKSQFVRDVLRRHLDAMQFRALRAASLPLAKAAGYLNDSDVFREVS